VAAISAVQAIVTLEIVSLIWVVPVSMGNAGRTLLETRHARGHSLEPVAPHRGIVGALVTTEEQATAIPAHVCKGCLGDIR
jgi:hypothetical protein